MSDTTSPLWTRWTLLTAAGLMIVCGVLLHLEGRIAWCKCGFGLWSAAWTDSTSQHFLDPYSLSHVLHGVIFYWLLRPFAGRIPLHIRMLLAIGMEIGWEVLENSPPIIERYRQDTAAFDYVGDSILNAMGDVVASVIGIAFAARFSWKASVALFFIFELWMLYLARDNLTLNILMLLFPLEPIKQWQLAH